MSDNPNTNCLDGMRCPNCGSYGPFLIEASITVLVTDEGTEDQGGDYEWHADSYCKCEQCEHEGTVANFTEPEPAAEEAMFMVFNATDGIYASPEPMSETAATGFIEGYRAKFQEQGYYKTADGERIPPGDVVLELRRVVTITPPHSTFRTSDGYTFHWSAEHQVWFTGKDWDDRDMECTASNDGWPLDDIDEKLEGDYITEETKHEQE